ncbi:MAG: DMT family transporter [Pseudomonadota bacterium]
MKLFLLTALTMTAFAGNSVLNKFAVGPEAADPMGFALIRIASGAAMLVVLMVWRERGRMSWLASGEIGTAIALSAYLCGFSLAYLTLDTGAGALVLFGVVQLTMFGMALWRGEVISPWRYLGGAIAFLGLCVLLWPSADVEIGWVGPGFMIVAGIGWGLYSIAGARAMDALAATTANFVFATPMVLLVFAVFGSVSLTGAGVIAAMVSGAITSALGYALWYQILPLMKTSTAALAQLSVPVIAALGGFALLSEGVTWRFGLATLLVLGGIALGLLRGAKPQVSPPD